jgi:hypothetical protein
MITAGGATITSCAEAVPMVEASPEATIAIAKAKTVEMRLNI